MTKYASAPVSQWNFHVTYQDFLDDLYLTYLYNPIGYSIIDTNLFVPYIHTELRREHSLLRHMLRHGLVRGHVRQFEEFNATELFHNSRSRDPRSEGFFQTLHASLRRMDVGAHLNSHEAQENALVLDRLDLHSNFLQLWPRQSDGSMVETGSTLEDLVKRIIDPSFMNSVLSRIDDYPNIEKHLIEISDVQEFIAQFIEPQRKYHESAKGLRVSSVVRAIAAQYGADPTKIDSTDDLLSALSQSGNSNVMSITKNALMILTDRHNKNISNFFQIGYSNPKSNFLTNMIAVSDEDHDQINGEMISVPVSMPDLRRFQLLPISDLDDLLRQCGFSSYIDAFQRWNTSPTEDNVQAVVVCLKSMEQKLREKYGGETREKYVASFWHGLQRTAWDKLVLCHIEAGGNPLATAMGTASEVIRALPKPVKTVIEGTISGYPIKGAVKGAIEVLGEKKYEQFALCKESPLLKGRFVTLHRNLARN